MRTKLIGIGVILVILASAGYLKFVRWQPEQQARLHQMAFFRAGEGGNSTGLERLVAEDYLDSRDWTEEELILGIKDLRRQFLTVQVIPGEMDIKVDEDQRKVVVTTKLEFEGSGPYADVVIKSLNDLKAPWEFTWEWLGPMPWDWELKSIENADLQIRGYRPGSLMDSF